MDSCPTSSNRTTLGYSRVALRKAFMFCGWSVLSAAIGYSVAGEQWANGMDSILHPSEMASGISAQNLSNLEICCAGMVLTALCAIASLVRGCILLVSERRYGA